MLKKINWFYFASPATFYPFAGKLIPIFRLLAFILVVVGLVISFLIAPADKVQGEGYRVIYLHVPAAWSAMLLYVVMAFWAGAGLAFNSRLSFMMAKAIAPTGTIMAFLALWTGAWWGKPMWGTWWVWDARLTSALILFFLYLGFIALQSAIDDTRKADKAGALIALVGVINVPIIYYSVEWWNTLHQTSSISIRKGSSMSPIMLWGMLIMSLAFWSHTIAASFTRLRTIILEREAGSNWVKEILAAK